MLEPTWLCSPRALPFSISSLTSQGSVWVLASSTTCPGYCKPPGAEGISSNHLLLSPFMSLHAILLILLPPLLGTHPLTGSQAPDSFTPVSIPSLPYKHLWLEALNMNIFCVSEPPRQPLLFLAISRCSSIHTCLLPFPCVSLISSSPLRLSNP